MTAQEPLFDGALMPLHPTRPVKTIHAPLLASFDSPESVDAGIANMEIRGAQEERVYAYLLEFGPATDSQIADALGLAENSARPRRVRLVEKHKVERVGTATSRTGRAAALWGVVR